MLVDIVNRQASLGHDVSLLVINDEIDPDLVANISPNVAVTLWHRRPGQSKLRLALKLNLWVRHIRPTAVHLHDPKLPGLLHGMDRKVVYTIHDIGLSQRYLRPSIRQYAISDAVMADAMQANSKASVRVIPNGIDFDRIRRRPDRPASSPLRIVQSARLDMSKKGQDILIKALAIVRDRGFDNITVDFIGSGSDREHLAGLARQLSVYDRVNFLGNMPRLTVYNSYADYDLMVHPARYEGFGLVIAEAMGAGVPVAVPIGGGPYEVIGGGRFGFTFAHDDPQACAEAIIQVVNNYDEALKRATQAQNHAIACYSLAAQVDSYIRMYSESGK